MTREDDTCITETHNGRTLLHCAFFRGDIVVMQALIKDGRVDINGIDALGNTIVDLLAFAGVCTLVQQLVLEKNALVTSRTRMLACYKGSQRLVRFLVTECGMDVNERFVNGMCPVAYAARKQHGGASFNAVRFLVDQGADVNPSNGVSPIYDASIHKKEEFDLHSDECVFRCNFELVEYLAEKGARAIKKFASTHAPGSEVAQAVERGLRKRYTPLLLELLPDILIPYIGEKGLVSVVADCAVYDYSDWLAKATE